MAFKAAIIVVKKSIHVSGMKILLATVPAPALGIGLIASSTMMTTMMTITMMDTAPDIPGKVTAVLWIIPATGQKMAGATVPEHAHGMHKTVVKTPTSILNFIFLQ